MSCHIGAVLIRAGCSLHILLESSLGCHGASSLLKDLTLCEACPSIRRSMLSSHTDAGVGERRQNARV